jgi:hypothetical protein
MRRTRGARRQARVNTSSVRTCFLGDFRVRTDSPVEEIDAGLLDVLDKVRGCP